MCLHVRVFSLHMKTVGRLTNPVISHSAGCWRVLTRLVCAYVRSFMQKAAGCLNLNSKGSAVEQSKRLYDSNDTVLTV